MKSQGGSEGGESSKNRRKKVCLRRNGNCQFVGDPRQLANAQDGCVGSVACGGRRAVTRIVIPFPEKRFVVAAESSLSRSTSRV
jgi:hypothetical protein